MKPNLSEGKPIFLNGVVETSPNPKERKFAQLSQEPASFGEGTPDEEFVEMARQRSQKKQISLAEAMEQVAEENPELTQRLGPVQAAARICEQLGLRG